MSNQPKEDFNNFIYYPHSINGAPCPGYSTVYLNNHASNDPAMSSNLIQTISPPDNRSLAQCCSEGIQICAPIDINGCKNNAIVTNTTFSPIGQSSFTTNSISDLASPMHEMDEGFMSVITDTPELPLDEDMHPHVNANIYSADRYYVMDSYKPQPRLIMATSCPNSAPSSQIIPKKQVGSRSTERQRTHRDSTRSSCLEDILNHATDDDFLDHSSSIWHQKDRSKKEIHNRIERKRRDFINAQINELGNIIPDQIFRDTDTRKNKGNVLRCTVEYIRQLQSSLNHLPNLLNERLLSKQLIELMINRLHALDNGTVDSPGQPMGCDLHKTMTQWHNLHVSNAPFHDDIQMNSGLMDYNQNLHSGDHV